MNRARTLRLPDDLSHMLEAVERCQEYVGGMDEAAFLADLPPLRRSLRAALDSLAAP